MKKLFLLLGLSCALFIGCQKAAEPAAETADPATTEEVETTEGGEAEAAEGEEATTEEE